MNTLNDIISLPNVSFSWRADLPAFGGIYFVVHDILSPVLHYVGQARNIRQRWLHDHHRAPQITPLHTIHWVPCEDEVERLQLEQVLIRRFEPKWNYTTTEQTIRDLASRLWLAEMNLKGLRASLSEAERTVIVMGKEISDLYATKGIDVRERFGMKED